MQPMYLPLSRLGGISMAKGRDTAQKQTVKIASGGTQSGAVHIADAVFIGIVTPAALTGTAFTFKVSDEKDGIYNDLYVGGTQLSITVAANRAIDLGPNRAALAPWKWMKIVSGSAEAVERTIQVHTK
jgi:hypothetical protein